MFKIWIQGITQRSYARETDKAKIKYVVNYTNDQNSTITAEEWQLVNYVFLLLKLFL